MYPPRYLQYINLPEIPSDLIDALPRDFERWEIKTSYDTYNWTDCFNEKIDQWCKTYICQDMYWGFQLMTGDVPVHRDIPTKTKFVYVLNTGGDNVETCFWDETGETMVDRYVIPQNRWHILKVDSPHSVQGIEPGKIRWSVTGKIF